jgi:hypothetical protein
MLNDQALMQGVTVKSKLGSKRKASVHVSKSKQLEFGSTLRINGGKEVKKRSTLLELEKIPKGYKKLEN